MPKSDIRSFFSGKGASKEPETKRTGTDTTSGSKRKASDTDATKVARKIKHPLPSILYHIRPGIIGRQVDAGFRVLQWGNLEHDRRVEIQATAQRAAREADALLPNQMTEGSC